MPLKVLFATYNFLGVKMFLRWCHMSLSSIDSPPSPSFSFRNLTWIQVFSDFLAIMTVSVLWLWRMHLYGLIWRVPTIEAYVKSFPIYPFFNHQAYFSIPTPHISRLIPTRYKIFEDWFYYCSITYMIEIIKKICFDGVLESLNGIVCCFNSSRFYMFAILTHL